MAQFKGSIAQTNVQFPIEPVIEPMAGENYSRALIFAPKSKADSYLVGVDADERKAGTLTELNASNFGSLTGALLRSWLVPFFAAAEAVSVGLALYDDAPDAADNTLKKVYEKFKLYAYFKFGIAEGEAYTALQAALSNAAAADSLYSRLWVGTADGSVLAGNSPLVTALKETAGTYRLVYNPDTAINPALAQLGKTLSVANKTGTPVGNSVDMVGFATIKASGALDADGKRENLNATQKAALDRQKIGYNTYVGDGTENVVTEGSLYANGASVGAEWVKAYITYMCKVKTANYISRMNVFRNDKTYQGILLILQDVVKGFLDMGRLTNFQITAVPFAELQQTGDTITVPNAWQADYIDGVRAVTVYGTLYITQPTR